MKRFLQALLVLLLVSLALFIMLRIVPGNPVAVLMGEHANQATIDRLTAELGLDQPIHIQFFRYLGGAFLGMADIPHNGAKFLAALQPQGLVCPGQFVQTLRQGNAQRGVLKRHDPRVGFRRAWRKKYVHFHISFGAAAAIS